MNITERPDGTSVYATVDGDMVDQIANAFYGSHLGTAELIYERNQNLSLQPMVLPAGILIILPKYTPPEPPGQIQLWD
ncbi:tail protein X [Mesorhizobium sp. NBSH29]|uniref:tail protein X n=1 Tax=Mesorhizobium sp. NBSH29 TaxID=2654249 RepID=UPI0018969735|nr:tail protein X [Mesorhizobium sp. NBSH29]